MCQAIMLFGGNMKIKKITTFLSVMLFFGFLTYGAVNCQSSVVEAAVFKKASVPKKFRGTWYGYSYLNNKLKAFKITRTRISLAGYADSKSKTRTYKYTNKAHNYQYKNVNTYSSHQLIKSKGNRMFMSYPMGETAAAYVTKNRKKLYVGVDTTVDTYYKSKSAAKKNYKLSNSRNPKLFKLVWEI